MPIRLTLQEKQVAKKLAEIKNVSGSHSPSPAMLAKAGVTTLHDFCYLSNPYATELFLKYFKKDFSDTKKLRNLIEYYPSQNRALAEKLATSPLTRGARPNVPIRYVRALHSYAGGALHPSSSETRTPPLLGRISEQNIFVGNGATEIIQAVLQNFVGVKLLQSRRSLTPPKIIVPVPTFSPYLEFVPKGVSVVLHQLQPKEQFRLNLKSLLEQVKKERPDAVVLINPNNPDGGYIEANELQRLLYALRNVEAVIVDESFIHFAKDADTRRYENADERGCGYGSVAPLVRQYPNLIVIKSLSKDFGIAGLRLGYAVMSEERVTALLERGYLWNVSGFGEYFLNLLNRKDFLKEYEKARLRAIGERDAFFTELSSIKGIKVYPSKANSFLIELLDGSTVQNLCIRLLVRHGIYVRTCYDKAGLDGEFVRVASRTGKENVLLVSALCSCLA